MKHSLTSFRYAVMAVMVFVIGAVAMAVVAGCAQFGVSTPKTFTERAAAAQITVTTIRSSALSLLNGGVISAQDARNAQRTADTGNEAIDLAVGLYAKACPVPVAVAASAAPNSAPCVAPDANAKLTAAVAILTATQSYLTARGAKP